MCFDSNTTHTLSLQMICILIYLELLLDTVLQFSLFPLISYLEVNKHNKITEHINWVLSELSVEHFSFHAFYRCGLQRDLMFCSSRLTLQRRYFSCTFPCFEKAKNLFNASGNQRM